MQNKKHSDSNRPKPHLRRSLIFFLVAVFLTSVLLILRAIAFNNSNVADFYTAKIFTPLARVVTGLTGLLPLSLTEILVVLGVPALLALLVFAIVRLIRNKSQRWRRVLRGSLILASVALIMFSLFLALFGINYARSPVADALEIDVKDRPIEELERAMRGFGLAAANVRAKLPEDGDGNIYAGTIKELQQEAYLGWDLAGERWSALSSPIRSKPKAVLLSRYWSYTKIVGMYVPMWVEANINIDQPDFMIPATIAHELAHTRGFARENETDFVALLSCFVHPDPVWQYSGLISAWKDLSRRLALEDRERWSAVYAETVTDLIAQDLNNESIYWKAYETPIAEVSTQINDSYLRANREEDGVKSYGGVVDLLLAWYETEDAATVLAAFQP